MERQASWKPAVRRFLDFVKENSVLEVLHPASSIALPNTRPFMPIDEIRKHFSKNKDFELQSIIKELSLQTDIYPKDILPRYTAVFATLLQSGNGCYIELFRHKPSLSDNALPFSTQNPPPGFPNGPEDRDLLAEFCREQWRFCAAVMEDSDSDRYYEEKRVLPIICKEHLAGGGTANLWRIKLYPTYNKILQDASKAAVEENETHENTFVLKEYSTSGAQSYYDNEIAAFRRIESNPNIIKYHGSFTRAGKFNIILEYANKGTLEHFLHHQVPPSQPEHIIQLWENLFKLIDALRGIHTVKPNGPPGPEIFQGWHQDVKPANILIVSKGTTPSYQWQFKLADLGISHFNKINNTSTPFSAVDSFGTRTYGAPESFRPDLASFRTNLKVNQNVDIWSLGCVYSEVLRWMADQHKGVQEYRKERTQETRHVYASIGGLDCFHNEEGVLDAVHKSDAKVVDELRKKDFGDPVLDMVNSIIKMVSDMLLSSDKRPNARALWNRQRLIIDTARASLKQYDDRRSLSPLYQHALTHPLDHWPRPPDDGPPSLPPVLPPEKADLYPRHPNTNTQRRGSKRSHAEMVMDEPGRNLAQSPEFYSGHFESYQSPNLSQHNSPFGTPSPYAIHTPVFRSTFQPEIQTGYISDNKNQTHSQPTHPDKFMSLNGYYPSKINYGEYQQSIDIQRHFPDSTMPPPEIPGSYPPIPHHPDHRPSPSPRRKTTTDYVTLDNVLDWAHGKTNSNSDSPRLNKDLLNRLNDREFVFLIDDSITMLEHWPNVCKVFKALTYLVRETGDIKIDLYFSISQKCQKKVKKSTNLLPMVQGMEDEIRGKDSTTDINIRLNQILEDYKRNLDSNSWWKSKPKPLSVYAFTDGIWEEEVTASEPIKNAVATLEDLRKDKRQIGIQFISFGNDPEGMDRLEHLDDRLDISKDIVDTEPYNGNVWKMLLGPIREKHDSQNRLYTLGSRDHQTSSGS